MAAGLKVRRPDLERALRNLAKFAKANQRRAEAVITFSKGQLTIAIPGMQVEIGAEGILLSRVRVPVRWLIGLSRTLSQEDPIIVNVERDYLSIGEAVVLCTRDHIEHGLVKLPLNAALIDILRVGQMLDREEIERSGLTAFVAGAEARRDRLLERAAELLAPLGVTREVLSELVGECVKRSGAEPRVEL